MTTPTATSETSAVDALLTKIFWFIVLIVGLLPLAVAWYLPPLLAARNVLWHKSRKRAIVAMVLAAAGPVAAFILVRRWDQVVAGLSPLQAVVIGILVMWLAVLPIAMVMWRVRVGKIANSVFDQTFDPNRFDDVSTAILEGSNESTDVREHTLRPVIRDQDKHWRSAIGTRVDDDRRSATRKALSRLDGGLTDGGKPGVLPLLGFGPHNTHCGDWLVGNAVVLPETATSSIVLGGTGSGKTTLICVMVAATLRQYGSVVYFNGKGDWETQELLRSIAEAQGVEFRHWTISGNAPFDAWQGTSAELITKVTSLLGKPTSAAALYYLGETRAVLERVAARRQGDGLEPWGSGADLLADLENPTGLGISRTALARVQQDVQRALAGIGESIDGRAHPEGWSWRSTEELSITLVDVPPHIHASQSAATLMLFDLLGYKEDRRSPDAPPLMVFIDEAQVLLSNDVTPPIEILTEQVRAANIGINIATQSVAGLGDPEQAERLLDSGVPIIAGRMPSGDPVSNRAGTRSRVETGLQSVDGEYTGITTSRVQDTFLVPPQRLRKAPTGYFVLIAGGNNPIWFKALPPHSLRNKAKTPLRPVLPQ